MSKPTTLNVTDLDVVCGADGSTVIKIWCRCHTTDDVDDIIAWLEYARAMMVHWRNHQGAE